MAEPPQHGPLLGDELYCAIERLTDKQLRAYQYRREGHALNWIATRMGISRTAVIHHVAKAEKRLGYEPTVTAKQKTPYKSAAKRCEDDDSAWQAHVDELFSQVPAHRQRAVLRILEAGLSDEEAKRRLAPRLRELTRERKAGERAYAASIGYDGDDYSRGVGQDESEFAANMEADFGINPMTGVAMRPEDLPLDDGKGYDRL